MENAPIEDIQKCLDLYLLEEQHINRNVDNFYVHLLSWNSTPYIVYSDNKVVGYFTVNKNDINEFIYKKGYKDIILMAILSIIDSAIIHTSLKDYNDDTLSKCDWYRIDHCEMAYVYNFEAVNRYLNNSPKSVKKASNLNDKQKVRYFMADGVNKPETGIPLFIFTEDRA